MAQPQSGSRLDVSFPFDGDEGVRDTLRALMAVLEARFQNVEELQEDAETQAQNLVNIGLKRINDVLLPSVLRIQKLTSLGFLVAESGSSVKLELAQKGFTLTEGDQRDLFTPSAYVGIERKADYNTRAIAKVLSYDSKVGFLSVQILAVFGGVGPFTDWVISASPGVTEATRANMDAAVASAAAARADRLAADADAAATHADAVQTTADRMQTALDRAAAATSAGAAAGSAAAAAASAASSDIQTRVSKAGDTMSGGLTAPAFSTTGSDGAVYINARDGRQSFVLYSVADRVRIFGTSGDVFSIGKDGSAYLAGVGGDLKTYVDKGIRSDFAMGISRAAMQTARRNIAIRTGRRYFTGNGGVANITAADLGGLIYLEADINTCNFVGVNASVDGDFAEVYCRGNVRFNSAGTDAYGFGFGDTNLSFFDAKSGDRFTLSMGADAWDVVGYTTRHNKALMADRALVLNDAERQQIYANADIAIPHGQCRLVFVSPTQVRLEGFNGNKIFINGNYRTIPAGGITISNGGVAANTLYYIYAYYGTSLALYAAGRPPIINSYGQKTDQDNSSPLVGMIYTNSSAQFQSDNNYQFVATWFNRRLVSINGAGFSGAVVGGNAFTGAGTAVYMLCWDDMAVRASAFGYAIGGATGAFGQIRLLLDGGTVVGQTIAATFYANGANLPMPVQWSDKVAVGVHSINAQILGNGGGASFTSDVRMESWI